MSSSGSGKEPHTPSKASTFRKNTLDRLEGRGKSRSPASILDNTFSVKARMSQDKNTSVAALLKGQSSQEKDDKYLPKDASIIKAYSVTGQLKTRWIDTFFESAMEGADEIEDGKGL